MSGTTCFLKITHGDNNWRARLERGPSQSLASLKKIISSKGICVEKVALRYASDDGFINLDGEEDFKEALELAKEQGGTNIIRVFVDGSTAANGSNVDTNETDSKAFYEEDGASGMKERKDNPEAPSNGPGEASKARSKEEEAVADFLISCLRSLNEGEQRPHAMILSMMPGGPNHEALKMVLQTYPNILQSFPFPFPAFLQQFGGFSAAAFPPQSGGCRQAFRRCNRRQCHQPSAASAEDPGTFGGQEASDFEVALQKAIEASLNA